MAGFSMRLGEFLNKRIKVFGLYIGIRYKNPLFIFSYPPRIRINLHEVIFGLSNFHAFKKLIIIIIQPYQTQKRDGLQYEKKIVWGYLF